jgi:hypothetical protein
VHLRGEFVVALPVRSGRREDQPLHSPRRRTRTVARRRTQEGLSTRRPPCQSVGPRGTPAQRDQRILRHPHLRPGPAQPPQYLPEETLRRLLEAFRLEIRYDKRTNSAHCRVTIAAEALPAAQSGDRRTEKDKNGRPRSSSRSYLSSAPGQARHKSTAPSPVLSRGRLVVEARAEVVKGGRGR